MSFFAAISLHTLFSKQPIEEKNKVVVSKGKFAVIADLLLVGVVAAVATLALLSIQGVHLGPFSGINAMGTHAAYALIGAAGAILTLDLVLILAHLIRFARQLDPMTKIVQPLGDYDAMNLEHKNTLAKQTELDTAISERDAMVVTLASQGKGDEERKKLAAANIQLNQTNVQLNNMLKERSTELATATQDNQILQATMAGREGPLQQLLAENIRYKEALEQDFAAMKIYAETLQQDEAILNERWSQLRKTQKELEPKLDAQAEALNLQAKTLEQYKEIFTVLSAAGDTLTKENERLHALINADQSLQTLVEENSKLMKKIQDLEEKIKVESKQQNELLGQKKHLLQENSKLEKNIDWLNEQINNKKEELNELELKEHLRLKDEQEILNMQIRRAKQELQEIKATKQGANEEKAIDETKPPSLQEWQSTIALLKENDKLTATVEKLNKEIQTLREEIGILKKGIQKPILRKGIQNPETEASQSQGFNFGFATDMSKQNDPQQLISSFGAAVGGFQFGEKKE